MKNALMFFVMIAFLTVSPRSHAETTDLACPNFRLDAGGSMANLEVYDQGALNACYAYTAAEMIDAWRFSHGGQGGNEGNRRAVSPLSLAVVYSSDRTKEGRPDPRNWISGGDPFSTVETGVGATEALCEDETVSQQISNHENAERNLSLLGRIWERYRAARDEAAMRPIEEALRQFLRSRGYRGSLLTDQASLRRALREDHAPRFLKAIFGSACQGRSVNLSRVPRPMRLQVHQSENPRDSRESDFSRTLRRMFSSPNPQPIGITYCADFLYNGTIVRNLAQNPDPKRPGNVAGCERVHASVIVGSRERNGRCEFLIRNTFGSNCESENYDLRRWECERGQVWVDETSLVRNVNEAGYLGVPLLP